jgi:hypothetical protein
MTTMTLKLVRGIGGHEFPTSEREKFGSGSLGSVNQCAGCSIFKPADGAISCAEANALGMSIIPPFSRYLLIARQRNGDASRIRSRSGQ